jgi:hypothetical protein
MVGQQKQHIDPDDEVYRVRAVWIGPKGVTFPFAARYSAWGLWLVFFVTFVVIRGLLFGYGFPSMELALALVATYAIMMVVDYDRPFRTHVVSMRRELTRIGLRRKPQVVRRDLMLQADVAPVQRRTKARRHPPASGGAVETTAAEPRRIPRPRLPRFALTRTRTTPPPAMGRRRRVDQQSLRSLSAVVLGVLIPSTWFVIEYGRTLING